MHVPVFLCICLQGLTLAPGWFLCSLLTFQDGTGARLYSLGPWRVRAQAVTFHLRALLSTSLKKCTHFPVASSHLHVFTLTLQRRKQRPRDSASQERVSMLISVPSLAINPLTLPLHQMGTSALSKSPAWRGGSARCWPAVVVLKWERCKEWRRGQSREEALQLPFLLSSNRQQFRSLHSGSANAADTDYDPEMVQPKWSEA